ncbi:rhodanese-like domain-containing protein [Paenibacillus chitinolyticus]|uniref:rhodanese-like domain-containing protein n=1 Tax=Paenibacillus chitinolyticus TaxID=79263 RepID=UPI00366E4D2A
MAFQIPNSCTPQDLARRIHDGEDLYILDVREDEEWADGHIEQAVHIPLGQLMQRLGELDRDREITVVCRSGNRSGLACELLTEQNFDVVNMTGGMNNWTDRISFGR